MVVGYVTYLCKPFSSSILVGRVRRLVPWIRHLVSPGIPRNEKRKS